MFFIFPWLVSMGIQTGHLFIRPRVSTGGLAMEDPSFYVAGFSIYRQAMTEETGFFDFEGGSYGGDLGFTRRKPTKPKFGPGNAA